MSDHRIYDLDAEMSSGRRPIDAGWSKRKKRIVAAAAGVAALLALGGGAYALYINSAPGLPGSVDEAVATIGSARWDNLDADRKRQYLEETRRLMEGIPWEERREMFRDDDVRDALREAMRDRMDEIARKFARGEDVEFGPPRRPRAEDEQGERPRRPDFDEMTPEERAAMRDRMRNMVNQRFNEMLSSGNAQSGALQMEMRQSMRSGRGAGPGGRRGR
jgi:hypothetical protein